MTQQTVKITNGTIVKGIGDARPGQVLTLDAKIARSLFIAGKAVPCAVEPDKPVTRTIPVKGAVKVSKKK